MPVKNMSYTVSYYVEDLQNGGGITGDDSNHTLRLLADGALIEPSGSIDEPDDTNLPGWYTINLYSDENIGDMMVLGGRSSTGSTAIRGAQWYNDPDTIANAVWDELLDNHVGSGTAGQALITTSGILIDSINIGSGVATARQLNNWGLILLNHLRDVGIEP